MEPNGVKGSQKITSSFYDGSYVISFYACVSPFYVFFSSYRLAFFCVLNISIILFVSYILNISIYLLFNKWIVNKGFIFF